MINILKHLFSKPSFPSSESNDNESILNEPLHSNSSTSTSDKDNLIIKIFSECHENGETFNKVFKLLTENNIKFEKSACETAYHTYSMVFFAKDRLKSFRSNKENRPFWKYQAVVDSCTTSEHLKLNGKIILCDDKIWNSIFPPNHPGCRCRVRALSRQQADAEPQSIIKGETISSKDVTHSDWNFKLDSVSKNNIYEKVLNIINSSR